ncbi:Metallo-peptidase family M12-domain-containing protein [Spinellus fusiger]|nr:Metallo-peptidase family M12-domain-containing protein [Spinellus fusiger]
MTFHRIWTVLLWAVMLLPWILAHSVNNRRLLRVEPLNSLHVNIAPRPETFFQKRHLSSNPNHTPNAKSIEYDDILRLAFNSHNQTFFLHLIPNLELFHPEAVLNNGQGQEEPLQHKYYRIYRGVVVDKESSEYRWKTDRAGVFREGLESEQEPGVMGWARIIIRHDIKHSLDHPIVEGTFTAYDDMYHIKVKTNYHLAKRSDDAELPHQDTSSMVIYRDSDTTKVALSRRDSLSSEPECGFDPVHHSHHTPPSLLSKRTPLRLGMAAREWGGISSSSLLNVDTFMSSTHSPLTKRATGCPTTKKINYMGAAADCTYVKYYQSTTNARMQIINDWNSASAAYERSFNISLGLINITTMSEICPPTPDPSASWNRACADTYTISNRLSDFSLWRSKIGNDGAGLWHLMTNCATGVQVGVAWLSKLCTSTVFTQNNGGVTEYVSGTGVSSIIRDEWKVVAHEIGHGFGAIHDCTATTCPCTSGSCNCCPLSATQCDAGGTYIMNPSSNVSTNNFSPCSITTICNAFPSTGTCLEEPGTRIPKTLQMCGNGIKEAGEDCDTGGVNSTCCNPLTCKFKPGAICEDSNDGCCSNCQLRASSYVCRPSSGPCDIQESCSGSSATCPDDKFLNDGTQCGNGLACASGQCTSRDDQCKARGTVMNVTRSCSSDSGGCQLICSNPQGLGCILFNGQFVDGTPCGIGGACKNGSCDLSNFGDNAKNWLENNKNIAIPVGVILGAILLLCVGRCIFYGCCGGSRYHVLQNSNKSVYVVGSGLPPPPPPGFYNAPYYPPPMQSGAPPPPGWVDPSAYNTYNPPVPPPVYSNNPSVPQTHDTYEMQPPGRWDARGPPPSSYPGHAPNQH